MNIEKTTDYVRGLITELRKLPAETGWLEFKQNNGNPVAIGEYISALSNTAALEGKANAYLVWGIRNADHHVVGTNFRPSQAKKGGEAVENWLRRMLSPRVQFRFYEVNYDGKSVVLLEIPRASHRPVQFQGAEYMRVGSHRQKLKDYPETERLLWHIFDTTPFEELIAAERIDEVTVLRLIDYPAYFDLVEQPLPTDRDAILARLSEDQLILQNAAGGWDITNLAAILFGKKLGEFASLKRKAVRVIVYEGKGRIKTLREREGVMGYASGFEGLIEFINALLPRNEVIGRALREEVPMYPEPAVRELMANALIHQDFALTGAGPMIEIFEDRMEITNPGRPLVSTDRFLDSPPRSRNEALASMMRRIGICEERGSGVDKVVFQTEYFQLPAPIFETTDESTRAVLFAHKALNDMDRSDRVRACYLHACLKYVERDAMTNSSLRERFGIEERNSAIASRIIRDTLDDQLIKPYDVRQSKRFAKYSPIWG